MVLSVQCLAFQGEGTSFDIVVQGGFLSKGIWEISFQLPPPRSCS